MRSFVYLAVLSVFLLVGSASAMQGMDHGSETKDKDPNTHMTMVDGIHAEFQVMDLASMNTTDPTGKTHHVMATFSKGENKIDDVVGKLKLVAPSGKEQISDLEGFGNGVFAANFTIDEPGKWGVVCLFKDNTGKHAVKFWHHNE